MHRLRVPESVSPAGRGTPSPARGARPVSPEAIALARGLPRGAGGRRAAAVLVGPMQAACGNRAVARMLCRDATPEATATSSLSVLLDERLLTDAEHQYVNPIEDKRVEITSVAAAKLLQLIQDITVGDAEMLRQAPYEEPGRKRPARVPQPKGEEAEKSRVRLAARRHLNLGWFFGFGPLGYDYLNDPRADKALGVIQQAFDMITAQGRRRLPRRVVPAPDNPSMVAERPLTRDVIRFAPRFFDEAEFTTQECFTWVVMHEYMHLAGAFHGENIQANLQKWPEYRPEFALADADHLTALVFDLALGKPFPVDCHKDPHKPSKRSGLGADAGGQAAAA